MNELKEFLTKYNIKPLGYTKNKNIIIITTNEGKYILKKRTNNKLINDIYHTLKLRNFNFLPKNYNLYEEDNYEIDDYIKDYSLSYYEKAKEIINLMSLLHNKTTTYEEISIDDYKIIYEEIDNKLNDLVAYYNELNNYIDNEIYMAPSSYLLVRNISLVYASLDFCKKELEAWYLLIKDNPKQRKTIIHNNLAIDHLLRNNNESYLISWDKAKYDIPIYDLSNFYRKEHNLVEFESLFDLYFNKYPLHLEEQKLLFILISIPLKVNLLNDEYKNCMIVDDMLDYLRKTEKIISKYYAKDKQEEDYDFAK